MNLPKILTRNRHLKTKRGGGSAPLAPHLLRHCLQHWQNIKLIKRNVWETYMEWNANFWTSGQAAACPPVYHTRWRLCTVPFNAKRQAEKLWIPIFIVFALTRPEIKPESTVSIADTLSIPPLIGFLNQDPGISKRIQQQCWNVTSFCTTFTIWHKFVFMYFHHMKSQKLWHIKPTEG